MMHIYILLFLAVLLILCVIKNKKKIVEGISETVIPPSEIVNTKTPAKWKGWSPSGKLGKCEGDCDRNSDCSTGLICMGDESNLGGSSNRQKYFKGQCTGNMEGSSADYCLDPNGPTEGFNNMKEGFGSIKEGLVNLNSTDWSLISKTIIDPNPSPPITKATEKGWFGTTGNKFSYNSNNDQQIQSIKNWLNNENQKKGYEYYVAFSYTSSRSIRNLPQIWRIANANDDIKNASLPIKSNPGWNVYYISHLFDFDNGKLKGQKEKQVTTQNIWDSSKSSNVNIQSNQILNSAGNKWKNGGYASSKIEIKRNNNLWQGVRYRLTHSNGFIMAGLISKTRNNWSNPNKYHNLDHALYTRQPTSGNARKFSFYEKGSHKNNIQPANWTKDDVIEIRLKGNTIQFLHNNTIIKTKNNVNDYPYYAAFAPYSNNMGLRDVKILTYKQPVPKLGLCGSDCMGNNNNCLPGLKCKEYVLNQSIPGCKAGTTTNQQFVVGKGYCHDDVQATNNTNNTIKIDDEFKKQQAIVNAETAKLGFTGTMKKRFFGLKNSIIEGAGNTSLFDDSEVTTKLDNIKNLLDANKIALENVNQLGGQTFTSTQIQNNDWYPEALKLYKPIFESIFPPTESARDLNLLASIIGFNMDNEDKLIQYLNKIYGRFNTYQTNNNWTIQARKIELYILALKILKWKISNDYIEYFKKADEKINAPSTNFPNFSLSTLSPIKSAIDTDPIPGVTSGAASISFQPILSEVNQKVGEKLMKKLNGLLNIPSKTNDPKLDLSTYVKDKINQFSGNRLAECKENCLQKQKNNLNCTGCGGNNKYFENEINFILHPPLKAADMAKLVQKYIFVYNKSKTGVDIRYYDKNIIKGGTDMNLLNFPYSGAYIKCSSSTTTYNLYPSSNPVIYWKGAGKSPTDYDKELTGVYYRPKYPLWGFTNIDVPTFSPSSLTGKQGFTNMGNLMKSNSLVQTFNNITQNRINDVFSFFKNNAFKTGIIEGNVVFDQLQQVTNLDKIYLNNTYLPHDGNSTQIQKINVKDSANKIHKWYKYVFTREASSISDRTANDTQFLNKILKIINDDFGNLYNANALTTNTQTIDEDKITKSTQSVWDDDTIIKVTSIFNIAGKDIEEEQVLKNSWNKAIINLYVNDDGDSFITTETEDSCADNICPNGEPQTNGQDESGLIKTVISDFNKIKNTNYLKEHMYFIHNTTKGNPFLVDSTNSDQINCNGCTYPMIQNGRSLLITKKGMFRVEFGNTKKCPDGFNTDFLKVGDRQQCGGLEYGTNCRLNYVTANTGMEEIPRCYELDGDTINSELASFRKTCESIPGMITDPNDSGKCITNNNYTYTPDDGGSAYKLTDEHLRTCYLYKDGVSNMCDPKQSKKKNGDCLCLFENEYDSENPKNVIGMKGKAIVEDSYCQAIDDTDLTFSECADYARWTTGSTQNIENKYFNIDPDNNQDMGYRMGCQGDLGADGSMTKFNFVDPSKRYGKRTHVRKWGDDELKNLSGLKEISQSVCKTDYTEKQRLNVAKNIDAAETVLTEHVVIPGMPEKSLKTGNYLITKTSSQQRDYAKDNCNSQKSWDACYMSGSTEFLNKGDEMVKDAGYSEFKLYGSKEGESKEGESKEGESKEGFMGFRRTLREGATGSSGCLKNCAPMRFSNGNCEEDVKTTKDVNGIQRFFKMCPQECLTPLDPRYEDIDKSGSTNDDGTRIAYDAATHGCRTSKQCEDTCDKTEIQIKHIYDNRCKEDEECTLSQLKSQFENAIIGKIKYNNTIKITQVEINNDLITKYSTKQGLDVTANDNTNEKREKAILNFIEELKKNPTGRGNNSIKPQIIGISYQMTKNSNDILHIIYKKANVFAKLEYDSAQKDWRTYIHKRTWKDYWYDPNKPSLQSLTRNLTEEEMQRMQGVDIGISMDAFDKIPLYWQNDKTKEANSNDICEWIDNKIKAGVLKDKDECTNTFKSSWDSRTLGIGKTPTKGLTFEEYEQVYNLKQYAEEGSPYTDMSNSLDTGKKDLSLDDFYKRNLLKSKVENRLGGSSSAYTKTYKPLNPEARPKFFNSAWGLFH